MMNSASMALLHIIAQDQLRGGGRTLPLYLRTDVRLDYDSKTHTQ